MVWSVLTTIFCCFITGIVAIVYSSQVNTYLMQGNMMAAKNASNKAKIWNIVGASVVGAIICFWIIMCILGILTIGSIFDSIYWRQYY